MGSWTHFYYQHSNAHSSLPSYLKLYPRTTYQVKTYRKRKAQKCSQFFVIWNCWVGICSSYGFYLHMRLLKPSNNLIQIVLMRWINQAFMLGPQTWVRLITLKKQLNIHNIFSRSERKLSKNYFLKMYGHSKGSPHNFELDFGAIQINFLTKCL